MMMMQSTFLLLVFASATCAFSPGSNDIPFSLSSYQKSRAQETSKSLDASRFHFQILFVDNDNFHGRIAEGIFERVADYNGAICSLFPASATIESSPNAPMDSSAPDEAVAVCESLGLCSTQCSEFGMAFSLSHLDEYDLIIALDEEVQALILRSLPAESGYEQKCRLLSEFTSIDFCGIHYKTDMTDAALQYMIDPELWERAEPFYSLAKDSSSSIFSNSAAAWKDVNQPRMILSESGAAVPNANGWPMVEAAIVVACAGVTRFCKDTMDNQFDTAFQSLLDQHFCRTEHLEYSVSQADDQLRKGSGNLTGYFSPKERCARIEQHLEALRKKLV